MTPLAPLVEELIPCPDPWVVARKLSHLPNLLFLDSADRQEIRGRYSYVSADPVESFPWNRGYSGDPFDSLQVELKSLTTKNIDGLPPFQGGIGFLASYDLAGAFEKLPWSRGNQVATPDFVAAKYDFVVSFDHLAGRAWIVSTGLSYSEPTAASRLSQVKEWLRQPDQPLSHSWDQSRNDPPCENILPQYPSVTSTFSREGYIAAVRRAVEYIHAGDIFQVNLSQRLLAPLTEHPLELYGRLRQMSPAPFACFFDAGDFQIASASPEQFLKVNHREVITRPIKGTRPRGRTPREDEAQMLDLVTDPKDRAENVMIVDLLRNDIGRVCEYGSVRVPRVCEVESYNYVHHLVSEVRGQLRPDRTAFDLLRAAFPGGSVTGAPKVRAMEIIAELEPVARGPYCGSIGYVGFNGAMDSNILIRTFTAGRGWLQFPVGGGIVADSDPIREYEETIHKAAGLLRALKV